MKVIIASLLQWSGTSGVQTHVREVYPFLEFDSNVPQFVCPHEGNLLNKITLGAFFILRKLVTGWLPAWDVWLYRFGHGIVLKSRLQRILSELGDCVVYAQCPISSTVALKSRRGVHQRVVLVVHFNISQADEFVGQGRLGIDGAVYKGIQKFETKYLPLVDGVVFVSEFMHQELCRRIPRLNQVPCQIIPNFIADPYVSSESGLKAVDLLCVGTLEPRKNQLFALQILVAARRRGTALTLSFIGDGRDRKMLERAAVKYGVAEDVYFFGSVANAADRFTEHRACLHVAKMESFGIVLIEAMSRSIPVFAPCVGGIPEVFTDGVEGRYIPLDDADEAARIILDWLSNPQVLAAAGEAAYARYKLKFSAENTGERLRNYLISPFGAISK